MVRSQGELIWFTLSFPMRKKLPLLLAFLFLIVHVGLWLRTHGTPATRDFTDSFGAWVSAENLVHPKTPNPWFLEDAATSPNPDSHPYWYSHNGNFPVYFWAPLVALGLGISTLSLLAGFILGGGLLVAYRMLRESEGEGLATVFVLLSIFNFYGVMLTGLNLVWAFSFPLFWGIVSLERQEYEESTSSKRRWLFASLLLAWYFEWGFSLFVTLTIFIARWLRAEVMPRRWLLTRIFPAVALSLALRFLQVGATIGFGPLFDDIFYTVSNRAFSTPTREFLKAFYEKHHLVLWGYQDQIFSTDFWIYSLSTLAQRLEHSFFPGAIFFFLPLSVIVVFASRFSRLHRAFKFPIELRASLLALFLLFFFIPAHLTHLYIHPFQPLLIFPLSLLLAIVLHRAWSDSFFSTRRFSLRIGVAALVLIAWPWFQFRGEKLRPLPGAEVFSAFKGKSFATNYLAAYPRYYTGQWATTVWGTTDDSAFTRGYVHEADQAQTNYQQPDYFLCIDNRYVAPCRVAEHFYLRHRQVAAGDGYVIFDLHRRKHSVRPASPIHANESWLHQNRLTLLKVENLFNSSGSESGWSAMGTELSTGWQARVLPNKPYRWGTVTDRVARIEIETKIPSLPLNTLAFLPQRDLPMGYFSHVHVEGSHDRFRWKGIADIAQKPVPVIGDWSTWLFSNDESFRFYRLTFSPTAGSEWLALASFRLANVVPATSGLP